MKYRLLPSNNKIFRLTDYLQNNSEIDWKQKHYKYEIGDIIFIYCSKPESRIRYKMKVIKTDISYEDSIKEEKYYWGEKHNFEVSKINNLYCRLKLIEEIDSNKLSITNLLKNGLKKAPQGSQFISESLLKYIMNVFELQQWETDVIDNSKASLYEGIKKTVIVNKYERNPTARKECIEKHGKICKVCGFDFEKMYGELGQDFIHIHHVVPISEIGKSYKIDSDKDLVPVCPNCHAMLHRGKHGKVLSVEELREIICLKK